MDKQARLDRKDVFDQKDKDGWLDVSFRIRGDAISSILELLQHCETIGGWGHSFPIEIDPNTSEEYYSRTVGFDGDGSDCLTDIKVNGKLVEKKVFLREYGEDKEANVRRIATRIALQALCANTIVDVVDMTAKPVTLPPAVKARTNKLISKLVTNVYFNNIPLDDIFKILAQFGIIAIQEDGTTWSGFLTGSSGQADFDLGWEGRPIRNAVLRLSWYRMPSNRYEIVSYVA
jgi:hypothetical protein